MSLSSVLFFSYQNSRSKIDYPVGSSLWRCVTTEAGVVGDPGDVRTGGAQTGRVTGCDDRYICGYGYVYITRWIGWRMALCLPTVYHDFEHQEHLKCLTCKHLTSRELVEEMEQSVVVALADHLHARRSALVSFPHT